MQVGKWRRQSKPPYYGSERSMARFIPKAYAAYGFLVDPFREVPNVTRLALDGYRPRLAQAIYDWHMETCNQSITPEVDEAYHEFIGFLNVQYEALKGYGIGFEYWDDDPVNPDTGLTDSVWLAQYFERLDVLPVYKSTVEELNVFMRSENLMCNEAKRDGATCVNDMFRAVHDTLGHFAHGNKMDFLGELAAYECHYQTLSDTACMALANETIVQNAFHEVTGTFLKFQPARVFKIDYLEF